MCVCVCFSGSESIADDGVWMVRTLWLTEVHEEDFNQTFTCLVSSSRGHPTGQFILLPAGMLEQYIVFLRVIFLKDFLGSFESFSRKKILP